MSLMPGIYFPHKLLFLGRQLPILQEDKREERRKGRRGTERERGREGERSETGGEGGKGRQRGAYITLHPPQLIWSLPLPLCLSESPIMD